MAIIPSTRGNPQATDIAVETALSMVGNGSREDLQATLGFADAEIAKLFEDRNVLLAGGGTITNTSGTSLSFGSNFTLYVNSNVAGASPYSISIDSSPWSFSSDGNMVYAVINRTAQTMTLTTDASTLPAVTSSNQEVFLLAKRVGTTIFFRNGSSLASGSSGTLGNIASGTSTTNSMVSNNNSNGTGGTTVATGTSLFNPYLNIVTGDTVTVNSGAQLVSVTTLTINGTLSTTGTAEVRVL